MLIGLVGKPSTGKSTFFRAVTLAEAEIASYPFTTIKPNEGIGFVKIECSDKDFNEQCTPRTGFCINHKRFIPVQLMDVAGLVPGAHEGKGMGNQFLDDLRQADVLIHVIDVSGSTNEKGEQVSLGSYNPAEDVKFLEVELDQWYLQILKKGWEKFARTLVQEKKHIAPALANQLSGVKVTEEIVEAAIEKLKLNLEKPQQWTDEELSNLATELRKRTKPMIIAANKIDLASGEKNIVILRKQFPEYTFIGCSAESELALKEAAKKGIIYYIPGENNFKINNQDKLNEKQKLALNFIDAKILKKFGSTGVQDVLDKAVFEILKYMAIFPGGVNRLKDKEGRVLPDCFLMPGNSTALDFAYKLHTDFGKNFIRAIDVKTKRTVGKEHLLKNRDVVEIVCGR